MELVVHVFFFHFKDHPGWCRTRSPQDDEVICAESFDDRIARGEEYEEARGVHFGQCTDRIFHVGNAQ